MGRRYCPGSATCVWIQKARRVNCYRFREFSNVGVGGRTWTNVKRERLWKYIWDEMTEKEESSWRMKQVQWTTRNGREESGELGTKAVFNWKSSIEAKSTQYFNIAFNKANQVECQQLNFFL